MNNYQRMKAAAQANVAASIKALMDVGLTLEQAQAALAKAGVKEPGSGGQVNRYAEEWFGGPLAKLAIGTTFNYVELLQGASKPLANMVIKQMDHQFYQWGRQGYLFTWNKGEGTVSFAGIDEEKRATFLAKQYAQHKAYNARKAAETSAATEAAMAEMGL